MSLKCPKCGENLNKIKVKDVEVDQCPNCQGVWFDFKRNELLKILQIGYDNLPEKLKESWEEGGGKLELKEENTEFKCPKCGNKLSTYWYLAEEGKTFLVDSCEKGCGVWLDDGELKKADECLRKIFPAYKNEKIKEGIFQKLLRFLMK